MTTIQIAYEVSAATVAKIEQLIEHVALSDINWNGAAFKIERSEFTCIADDVDQIAGTILLGQIFDLIEESA